MSTLRRCLFVCDLILACLPVLRAQSQSGPQPAMSEQLFALANQARAHAGLPPLAWDPTLAEAARKHCERMSVEGPIEHQYPGELGLAERASLSGAHFSLIEENIAFGQYPAQIHDDWMRSEGHRQNLLSPEVDHVGIAVIARRGNLYAVVDLSRATRILTPEQIEAEIAGALRSSGLTLRADNTDARRACALDRGLPNNLQAGEPMFVSRWQSSEPDRLPPSLAAQLRSGQYRQAAVGSCPARGVQDGFTQYRVAVLLY